MPLLVRPAGGIDPSVSVLAVSQPDGTPLAIVENYALHLDTVGGTSTSADFPHYELGVDIKHQSPFRHTVVIELANDNIGYVPRREDYANGGYEVASSRLAPGGGEQIVETALRLLKRLRP